MGRVFWFDFTCKEATNNREEIIEFLTEVGKKWAFQLEKGGETGYVHYQGRVALKVKTEIKKMIELSREANMVDTFWSYTSKNGTRDFAYVTKEEGRVDGPWTHDLPDGELSIHKEMKTAELHPWQAKMIEVLKEKDSRTIHCIWDPIGGNGKSWFKDYLMWKKLARVIPPLDDMKDIMACAMAPGEKRDTFVFDMPRQIRHEEAHNMYTGIECLKDGRAFDTRYQYRELQFERPNILILTNTLPAVNLLSLDRWKLWFICPKSKNLRNLATGEAALLAEMLSTVEGYKKIMNLSTDFQKSEQLYLERGWRDSLSEGKWKKTRGNTIDTALKCSKLIADIDAFFAIPGLKFEEWPTNRTLQMSIKEHSAFDIANFLQRSKENVAKKETANLKTEDKCVSDLEVILQEKETGC